MITAPTNLTWDTETGLIPVIVQDATTMQVLMLGYMNQEALTQTETTGRVTFYSRSRQTLWEKGETSQNTLIATAIDTDCDRDTLLVQARPAGPTCHTGTQSCFGTDAPFSALYELENTVAERITAEPDVSYTASLAQAGIPRAAQKVGEEGVETAIAAVTGNGLVSEAADLLYHLIVLLKMSDTNLAAVEAQLQQRQGKNSR